MNSQQTEVDPMTSNSWKVTLEPQNSLKESLARVDSSVSKWDTLGMIRHSYLERKKI